MNAFPGVARLSARTMAAVVSASIALCGGIAAFATSDYAPASHAFVNDRVDTALQSTSARMTTLQRESNQTRLQINRLRGEGLRNSKFAVDQALAVTIDPNMRQLLQQRSGELNDAIEDVAAERKQLQFQSP